MSKQDPWISIEDAIEEVMKHKNCSRRTARRLIAAHMKAGNIGWQERPHKQKLELLDLETTRRLAAEGDPDRLLTPLSELIRAYRYTGDELLGELRAGRLVATPLNESAALKLEVTNSFSFNDFVITQSHLKEWIANPATPSGLIEKMYRKLQ